MSAGDASSKMIDAGWTNKKWDNELKLYREARAQGIQPDGTSTAIRSDNDKFYGMVKVFPNDNIVITKDEHDKIAMGASSADYSSLFIAVTPDGVFQFNLSLLRLEFEDYTDVDAGTDIKVADLDVSNGVQILEWYPEFASEDEYIDALMSNGDAIGFDESDSWWYGNG